MRIYYASDIGRIYVEGTSNTWAPRSLVVTTYPDGAYVCVALAGTCILGPLTAGLVQRQDGTGFSDLPSAVAYLQGEFGRSGSGDGVPVVAGASMPAGTPVAVSRANGQLVPARADTKVLAFVAGLLAADVEAGFVCTPDCGAVTLPDWTAIAGTSSLSVGQPYFLDAAGGITLAPDRSLVACIVRIGLSSGPNTIVVQSSVPIQL